MENTLKNKRKWNNTCLSYHQVLHQIQFTRSILETQKTLRVVGPKNKQNVEEVANTKNAFLV